MPHPTPLAALDSRRMLSRLPRFSRRTLHGLRDLSVGLGVFGLYIAVTHGMHPARETADAHGRLLLRVEEALHIAPERSLNEALPPDSLLALLASYEYAYVYVLTTFGVLGWLWATRHPAYDWGRNTLILVNLLAISGFAAWPATPPRLLEGSGFVDVVAVHHPPGSWGSSAVSGANEFAAMPSLHFGWATWVSAALLRAGAGRAALGAGAVHLVITGVVVMATANHYVLDLVAGVAVVVLAVAAERLRDRGWAVLRDRLGRRAGPRLLAAT